MLEEIDWYILDACTDPVWDYTGESGPRRFKGNSTYLHMIKTITWQHCLWASCLVLYEILNKKAPEKIDSIHQ